MNNTHTATRQRTHDLDLVRREVVTLASWPGHYVTVEGARETQFGWLIRVRSCKSLSEHTFEVPPTDIIELPVKLQLHDFRPTELRNEQ